MSNLPKQDLGQEEIDELMRSLATMLVECNLGEAKVEIFREVVCDL